MTLGKKEEIQRECFYFLLDGTKLTREEWTSMVKKHIQQEGNGELFDGIKKTVTLWNKHDSSEEVAMHVYASKYCRNLQVNRKKPVSIPLRVVKDDMGCSQLALC